MVLLMRRQSNPITPHETLLELFWSKYEALVGLLSSSIWVLHQGLIFLAAMEWKNILRNLFCFKHVHYKVLIFFKFSFMAYGNLATSPKRLESELTNVTRWHPFFILSIPLFTFSCPNFFRYLFVLTNFDSSWRYTHTTTPATGT